MDQQDKIARAMAYWPRLAALANLSTTIPRTRLLHSADDPRAERMVVLVGIGSRELILKSDRLKSGEQNEIFSKSLAAQKSAHLRLSGNQQGLRVPALIAVLADEDVALMEHLGGEDAAHLIEAAPDREAARAVLAACAVWLGEFHRSSRGDRRPYQTRFVMDHFRSQRAAVISGQIKIAEPELYLRLSRNIEFIAADFDGAPAQHAQRHGDYNMRNVLIDRSSIGAIDFGPEQIAPVGHDIARFLIDYVTLFGEHARIPTRQVIKRKDLMVFLNAYGFSSPEDASIRFLLNTQLLAEWVKIPAQEDKRSLVQILRLQGLVQTARRVFPEINVE